MPTLKQRADFLRLAKGIRRNSRAFGLQAAPALDGDGRFGFTVTKKVGNAPVRNRIRRRLREAARAVSDGQLSAVDIVVVGRRACLAEPFAPLCRALSDEIAAASRRVMARPASVISPPLP